MTLMETIESGGVKFDTVKRLRNKMNFTCSDCKLKEMCHRTDMECTDFIEEFLQIENNYGYNTYDILVLLGVANCFTIKNIYKLNDCFEGV